MYILHTSDWHLGKRLGIFSRHEEQEATMREICAIADNTNADIVVVAGDIFDTYNPPIEATELYYRTVKRLSNYGERPVIVIAGNHDSPDRIESSDPLAKELGIIQIGFPKTTIAPFDSTMYSITHSTEGGFSLRIKSGENINIIHTAFCNEQRFGIPIHKSLTEALQDLWQSVVSVLPNSYPTLLLTHALMVPNDSDPIEEPEGERPIEHISEKLSSAIIPKAVDYVALGHLHRYQKVGEQPVPVVYSGSPLAYSFSESNQTKYVSGFDTNTKLTEKHALSTGKKLIRKHCSSTEEALSWAKDNTHCWAELHIATKQYLTPKEISKIKEAHQGIVSIVPVLAQEDGQKQKKGIDLTKSRLELFKDYFISKKQLAPSEDIIALFNEIVATHEQIDTTRP